eukprot:c24199_g1_i1 orf=134-1660(+)
MKTLGASFHLPWLLPWLLRLPRHHRSLRDASSSLPIQESCLLGPSPFVAFAFQSCLAETVFSVGAVASPSRRRHLRIEFVGSRADLEKWNFFRCMSCAKKSQHREREADDAEETCLLGAETSSCLVPPAKKIPKKVFAWRRNAEPSEDEEFDPLVQTLRQLNLENIKIAKRRNGNYVSLTQASISAVVENVKLLMVEELTPHQVKSLLTESKVLVTTTREQLTAVLTFLKMLAIRGDDAGKVLMRRPRILSQSFRNLERKLKFLEDTGIAKESLTKVVVACPLVICLTLETLQKRVSSFQAVGIEGKDIGKIIWKNSRIFTFDLDKRFATLEGMGVDRSLLRRYLVMYPRALWPKREQHLQKMELLKQLGFPEGSKQIFRALFCLSSTDSRQIQARFEWLKEQGLSQDEVTQIVTMQPDILGRSNETLLAKADFLVNVLNRSIKEVVKFPAFFTYSLEKRIIPRFNIALETVKLGIVKADISLSCVLARSDKTFEKLFIKKLQKYMES